MSVETRLTISVVLIAKNNEATLPACLDSVQWADEIILLDSGSTDRTIAIAEEHGAKVFIDTNWHGYGRQRQKAQQFASCDYIFMIDTDEQVTEELKTNIKNILSQTKQSNTIYSCARRNWFIGRYMMHCGWYPDRVIRLYLNDERTYNDNLVHEAVDTTGAAIINLNGDILHETCTNYIVFQRKQLVYAQNWAEERHKKGKKVGLSSALGHALGAFIKTYFIRKGFLAGSHGLLLSVIITQYTFNKYAELWILNRVPPQK